jgi:hypothetical protein
VIKMRRSRFVRSGSMSGAIANDSIETAISSGGIGT